MLLFCVPTDENIIDQTDHSLNVAHNLLHTLLEVFRSGSDTKGQSMETKSAEGGNESREMD